MPRKSKHNHLATAILNIEQSRGVYRTARHTLQAGHAIRGLLDLICTEQTGFDSFNQLVAPNQGNYVPTIEVGGVTGWEDRLVLAYHYDKYMKDHASDKRAYRMGFDHRKTDLTMFAAYREVV
jgi:hypothetical protein